MPSPSAEFDLLFAAPDPWSAKMARDLLAGESIPSLLHGGVDRVGDCGMLSEDPSLMRPDLYVPKGARAHALAVLEEAWGKNALSGFEQPPPLQPEGTPETPRTSRWGQLFGWSLLALFMLIDVLIGARCWI